MRNFYLEHTVLSQNRARVGPLGSLFFGWWVVAGGFILQLLNAGLMFQVFGAYFVHLQREFGWSRTLLSGSYSLAQFEMGVIGPVQGWLLDRLGPRTISRVGVVLFGLGVMLLSLVHSTLFFYAAFFVIAIGSALTGWVTLNVTVANWFRRKRATAIGLVATGGSVGGLLVPAVAWALEAFGWRHTALGSGALILLIGVPLAQLMRKRPEDYGLAPDGQKSQMPTRASGSRAQHPMRPRDESATDFTTWEALRSPAFWYIGLGHSFAVLVVSAVNVHLIAHLVERLHLSLQLASTMMAIMTLFTIVGQVGGGLIGDRVEKRFIAALAMGGHVLGVLALAFASSMAWVLAFAFLHGLAWGTRGPLMSAIRADYFGRSSLGTIMGFSSLVVMFGSVAGPLLAGFLADKTGDYRLGFSILAGLGALATLFFLLARKPARPGRAELMPPTDLVSR
ncbi:MAG: MFS transporter [Chloroflexi bacterium]|nr:MFS transporter [Chloroflexota bacterium]